MSVPHLTIEQALAKLDRHKHWRVQCLNSTGKRRRYECTIWGDGHRVSGTGMSPIAAINLAEDKLKLVGQPKLKVVR